MLSTGLCFININSSHPHNYSLYIWRAMVNCPIKCSLFSFSLLIQMASSCHWDSSVLGNLSHFWWLAHRPCSSALWLNQVVTISNSCFDSLFLVTTTFSPIPPPSLLHIIPLSCNKSKCHIHYLVFTGWFFIKSQAFRTRKNLIKLSTFCRYGSWAQRVEVTCPRLVDLTVQLVLLFTKDALKSIFTTPCSVSEKKACFKPK